MKQKIKLTESTLRKIVKEIVSEMLIENTIKDLPNVKTLGCGEFDGILWGHTFLYEGDKYYSETGWSCMFPMYCKMIIDENGAHPNQVEPYQRPELKELFI